MKPGMPQERKEKLIGTINIETDRLTRLINDLLDLARIEAGSMKWRDEEVSIEDIIRDAITSIGPLFENKGLRLTTALAGPSPPLRGPRPSGPGGDQYTLQCRQVHAGRGRRPYLSAPGTGPRAAIVVEITDTGMGIPPGTSS